MPILPLASATWKFRDSSANAWQPATVPGCVHTDLRAAGKIPDPFFGRNELDLQWIEQRDWEYRARFVASPALLAEEVVELVADGLDTIATVTLNGLTVARTDNMFIGHRWPVKRHLRPGTNELHIRFHSAMAYLDRREPRYTPPREFNDPVGASVCIRKQQCQFGWDWGPRFVTAGIWRDIRLEAWTANRLADVRITQTHRKDGSVLLNFAPELTRKDPKAKITGTISHNGRVVSSVTHHQSHITSPALWWPSGQGAQPLYDVTLTAHDGHGRDLGTIRKRIGLRTIELDRSPDQWGESFRFLVNGRPVFLKGANWIPAHSFVAGLKRADYERDLRAAVAANMNAMRVWGGGVYESEDFYDLCDELGLLVWQDFMFACTLYPGHPAFLASVRCEAEQQAKRLRHRASLALWCGNNELAMLNPTLSEKKLRRDYEQLFHRTLPSALAREDPVTPYWPTSPWRGTMEQRSHQDGEKSGDTHFWDVWHARHPVKDYEKWAFRFVSEFGMQSYSSPATNATFCPPGRGNVFGPTMESHQKNRSGNQIILDYVSRRYRLPNTQSGLIYLSQLNQAYCMQVGVEHYRRLMPRCMGALYWQLNDCWPVASWSSIEFTGRWKALHHAARRFFAPALVSAHIPGDEKPTIGNYRESTVDTVHIHTVYDATRATTATLVWELRHLDGRRLQQARRRITLIPGQARREHTLNLQAALARHGRDHLYVRLALTVAGVVVSEQTVFLCPPRFLELPAGKPRVTARPISPVEIELTLKSRAFLHAVELDWPGLQPFTSDNYFDLYPGVTKTVRVTLTKPLAAKTLLARLRPRSLVDVCD